MGPRESQGVAKGFVSPERKEGPSLLTLPILVCSVNFDLSLLLLLLLLDCFSKNTTGEDDDSVSSSWGAYQTALWEVWNMAIGEIDDGAYPTHASYFLFTAFGLMIVIIMMVRRRRRRRSRQLYRGGGGGAVVAFQGAQDLRPAL